MNQPEPLDTGLLDRTAVSQRPTAAPWSGRLATHRRRAALFLFIILLGLLLTLGSLARLGAAPNAVLAPFFFPNAWMGLLSVRLLFPTGDPPAIVGLLIVAAWFAYWVIPVVGTLTSQRRRFQILLVLFSLLTCANIAGSVSFLKDFCLMCGFV